MNVAIISTCNQAPLYSSITNFKYTGSRRYVQSSKSTGTTTMQEVPIRYTLYNIYVCFFVLSITYLVLTTLVTFDGKKEGIDCWILSHFLTVRSGKRNAKQTSARAVLLASYFVSGCSSSPWLFRNLKPA